MKPSTYKLVRRLKRLINDTATANKEAALWQQTPFEQRPPIGYLPSRALMATLLCAVRSHMNGRVHRVIWTPETQLEWIQKTVEKGAHEAWFRATVEAALAAAAAEKICQASHEKRFLATKSTPIRAVGGA